MDLAGAGATVPLTGFGYALGTGAMEGAMENGWLGAFTGGISATAGGVAAAILSATSTPCCSIKNQEVRPLLGKTVEPGKKFAGL